MKKKRYLIIACLLFSPSFFINVEASEGGSSSVGIEFYQNPATPAPKDAPPKTDEPAADPKEPAGPLQGDQRSVVRHRPPQLARSSLVQEARVRQT